MRNTGMNSRCQLFFFSYSNKIAYWAGLPAGQGCRLGRVERAVADYTQASFTITVSAVSVWSTSYKTERMVL